MPDSPASSPSPNSSRPGSTSSCSSRSRRRTSAVRRTGRSAACSSSTRPSSAAWASRTATTWPARTGTAAPSSTATKTRTPREWAEAYLAFAAGEKREWLRSKGIKFFPVVGWAERGGYTATGHGNSVPRFHIVWGTGPAILEPFIKTVRDGVAQGLVELKFRHRVDELIVRKGAVVGAKGAVLAPDDAGARRAEQPG